MRLQGELSIFWRHGIYSQDTILPIFLSVRGNILCLYVYWCEYNETESVENSIVKTVGQSAHRMPAHSFSTISRNSRWCLEEMPTHCCLLLSDLWSLSFLSSQSASWSLTLPCQFSTFQVKCHFLPPIKGSRMPAHPRCCGSWAKRQPFGCRHERALARWVFTAAAFQNSCLSGKCTPGGLVRLEEPQRKIKVPLPYNWWGPSTVVWGCWH